MAHATAAGRAATAAPAGAATTAARGSAVTRGTAAAAGTSSSTTSCLAIAGRSVGRSRTAAPTTAASARHGAARGTVPLVGRFTHLVEGRDQHQDDESGQKSILNGVVTRLLAPQTSECS